MPMLRLLAASLLAAACVLAAAAQAPANALPLTATITTQPFAFNALTAPSTSFLKSAKPGSFHFDKSKDSNALQLPATNTQPVGRNLSPQEFAQLQQRQPLLAQTNQPCAKLRVYGFTAQDLKSSHPHNSSFTDCTPASSAHVLVLQALPTVNTK